MSLKMRTVVDDSIPGNWLYHGWNRCSAELWVKRRFNLLDVETWPRLTSNSAQPDCREQRRMKQKMMRMMMMMMVMVVVAMVESITLICWEIRPAAQRLSMTSACQYLVLPPSHTRPTGYRIFVRGHSSPDYHFWNVRNTYEPYCYRLPVISVIGLFWHNIPQCSWFSVFCPNFAIAYVGRHRPYSGT